MTGASDQLTEQVDINYENSLLVNEVSQILANVNDLKGIFTQVIKVLHNRLDYDRALIMLSNPAKTRLHFQAGFGYNNEQLQILRKISFHLDKADSKGIFAISFQNQEPQLLNDIEEVKENLTPRSYEFALKMGVKSMICCPITYEDKPLGILAVDNIKSKKPLLQRDLNLLMGLALQIGSRIHTVKLEAHLRQVQKMEAVGNLAGGVAHDFNNILTTILGYSQMISMKLSPDDPVLTMVDSIHHAGMKASALTHQLLAFSRKQVLEMKVTNLNIIIEDMNKMISRLIGEDNIMKIYLSHPISNIMADPSQIGQILMNLAVNASDAMPNRGRISIETGDIFLDDKYATVQSDVTPGPYSMLSVTDTGKGMEPELCEKIFEPFFTTKETGKGTGLGLSTVYGIVKQHQGHIHVYSEPDHGTNFKIYFPVTGGDITEQEISENTVMARGTETIMIVDDEKAICSLILDTLQPLGYTTLVASCGDEALELHEKAEQKIDLVLSDVIMPGMNGKELVDKLKEKQPDLKAMLMSGYTEDVIALHGALDSDYILINKPLLPLTLANKIREVLDNGSS
jgi:signal transduction histidine kinase/CheY-like chemotaxis protein